MIFWKIVILVWCFAFDFFFLAIFGLGMDGLLIS